MGIMAIWETDQLAARNLLAGLRLDANDANLEIAAKAFAVHRDLVCEWNEKLVHRDAVEALESEAVRVFPNRKELWNEGFSFAEQFLRQYFENQNNAWQSRTGPTKGQILRGMIRSARRQNP